MSTYGSFKTDEKMEREGVWLDLGSAGKFKLARAGGANREYEKKLSAASKPHRRAIETGTIDPKVSISLLADVFADTVVLGWEGVTGEDGKPLSFTVENCRKLLNDLPELFVELQQASAKAANFRREALEIAAGNSQPASGTH